MGLKRGKKPMRIFFIALLWVYGVFISSTIGFTQNTATDCDNTFGNGGAQGICSNENLDLNSNGPGGDDFSPSGNSLGCIDREHQTAWLFIQIEEGSTLGFTIDPIGYDDYDFAVYGPDRSCDNLGSPIRCSWAAGSSNTGMDATSSDYSEGASGNGFVKWLYVNPGETYYILIDNYSSTNQGFSLNWVGNSSLDCDVTLPCPVIDLGNDTAVCGGNSIEIGVPAGVNETYVWSTGATTNTITVADSGLYWIEATKNGCVEYDSIYVSLGNIPVVDLGFDTTLCEGESVLLDANVADALYYLWQDGSTFPLHLAEDPGNYSVRVSNDFCAFEDDINVAFDQLPEVDLGIDTILCDNSSFVLDATSPYANSYVWQDGSTNSTYASTVSGLYWVILENSACEFRDSIQVDFKMSPTFSIGDDDNYCEGDTILLSAFIGSATGYEWQDGSYLSDLEVFETGNYWVDISNDLCVTRDSIALNFLEYPALDLGTDTTLCEGDMLTLLAYSPLSTDYVWQDGSTAEDYLITTQGTYHVLSSNDVCSVSDTIEVAYDSMPVFDLGLDTIICKDAEYSLIIEDQGPNTTYLWQDFSTDSIFIVSEQGLYSVDVSNQCGTETGSVFVEYGSCDCNFFMATGFTPNNDGVNDAFEPIVDCDSITSYSIEIFNRWGESVFRSDDPAEQWMSPNNSDDYPMGAYVWAIEYKWRWRGSEMSNKESGFFTLLR